VRSPVSKILVISFIVLAAVALAGCFPGLAGQQNQVVKTDPVYSPDGSRIVFVSTYTGNAEIYIMNSDSTGLKRLTDNKAVDAAPSWDPNGSRIIFTSDRSGQFELYTMNPDGSQQDLLSAPVDKLQ
jgi:Tol biopolymer transport system component